MTTDELGGGEVDVYDVIVIGGGPAGSTAALYAVRAGLSTLVLDKGVTAGSLGMASKIANYPGIEGTIEGAELVRRMRRQAEGFGAKFVQARVLGTWLEEDPKQIQSTQGIHFARAVIVATGSMGRAATIPGEERLIGRGVSYCATCDGAFFRGEPVAVAGNSDEALEEALFLARFASEVHLLSPTPQLQAEEHMVQEVLQEERILLHPEVRLVEILGDGEVTGVKVRPREGEEKIVSVKGVFLFLQGRRPITDFLGDQVNLSESGCVEVDETLQTRVPGVFAAGDVLCNHIKQAVIAAAEGARAAIAADRYLSGRKNLRPDWA
ncbi:MAG: FAD-dependent oxidoreductase [Chloroflexi bacterium]|nr:FAD-dependent oxidoreductase [Chloroflexota bacterium]